MERSDEKLRTRLDTIPQIIWAMLPDAFEGILRRAAEMDHEPEPLAAEVFDYQGGEPEAGRLDVPRTSGTIAVLPIHGVMDQRAGFWSDVSTDAIGAVLGDLVANPNIGAVVLDIDSPGGSVFGVSELAATIRAAGKAKPVYAIANSMAASAAYWVGSAAEKLFVSPGGRVGGIGVWIVHGDHSGALEQAGVDMTLVSAGKFKTEGNPWQPLPEEAKAAMQVEVDKYYGLFAVDVARSRGKRENTVREGFGQGRMVLAEDAVKEGMADGIATLPELLGALLPLRRQGSRRAQAGLAIETERGAL